MEAESLLTPEERQDIIDVSRQLFDRSILLVSELDRMLLRERIQSWMKTILYWTLVSILLLIPLRYFGRLMSFL